MNLQFNRVNKYAILALSLCTVVCFTSCKSSESAYKKAYEKAKLQGSDQNQQTVKTDEPAPVKITPVTTTTTPQQKTETKDEPVKQEKVDVISGEGLKDYSVVCGSFTLKANAEGLQGTLKKKGYSAQIAYNSANKMYRVIATTFASKEDAVKSRNDLRATYPDAWLLFNK